MCFAKKSKQKNGVPYGIRTRVIAVKGRYPRPLDEGDIKKTKITYVCKLLFLLHVLRI